MPTLKMNEIRIKFSRHSKRRMRLYAISESTVEAIIERHISSAGILYGKNEFVDHQTKSRVGFPIKVVYSLEKNHAVVITAYPLKRGKK
jgi:hypothetical protein